MNLAMGESGFDPFLQKLDDVESASETDDADGRRPGLRDVEKVVEKSLRRER